MILYRLLRDSDIKPEGIVARKPQSKASVIDHVVGAKENMSWWGGTKYISTCKSFDAVISIAKKTGSFENWTAKIAEIDTNTLPEGTEIIDLSNKENRNAYIHKIGGIDTGNRKYRRFEENAESSKEILVVGKIPTQCIKIRDEVIQSVLYRLLRDEEVSLIENGDSITAKSLLSDTSVVDYVTLGSTTKPSKYISTCASLESVRQFTSELLKSSKTKGSKTFNVARITLNKLIPHQFELVDLRKQEERDKYDKNMADKERIEQFHDIADKYTVVLMVGHIPSHCIEILKMTYDIAKDEWSE